MQTLKSLFVTLLILGGAFLAYDYYLAPVADKLVFKKPPPQKPSPPPLPPAPAATPVETVMPTPPTPPPTTPPAPVAPPAPAPDLPPPPPVVADRFVPPMIPDAAQATQNWTRIPSSAFPRVVKLKKPVTFKASFGSTQVAAGAEVTVIAAQHNMLTVAPNAASTLRGTVAIDDTNLKAVLTGIYDGWRSMRVEEARLAWQNRKNMPEPAAEPAVLVETDGRPQQALDGTYPLLLASMKAGQVTEVTPKSVKRWGSPQKGDFKGQPCWMVSVEFDAQTAFGKISSEALARVVSGRVVGWYYKGSDEPMP